MRWSPTMNETKPSPGGRLWLVVALLILTLAWAASSQIGALRGGSNGDSDLSPVPLEAWPEGMAKAMCSRVDRCCNEEERQIVLAELEVETIADCEEKVAAAYAADYEKLAEAERAGHIAIDTQLLAECIAGVETGACSEGLGQRNTPDRRACEAAFQPLVDQGGECTIDIACKSGNCAWWRYDDEGNRLPPGHCQEAHPGRGERCDGLGRCAEGNRCNDENICSAPLPDGAPCESYADCASGHCERGDADQGTCSPSTGDLCRGG